MAPIEYSKCIMKIVGFSIIGFGSFAFSLFYLPYEFFFVAIVIGFFSLRRVEKELMKILPHQRSMFPFSK